MNLVNLGSLASALLAVISLITQLVKLISRIQSLINQLQSLEDKLADQTPEITLLSDTIHHHNYRLSSLESHLKELSHVAG